MCYMPPSVNCKEKNDGKVCLYSQVTFSAKTGLCRLVAMGHMTSQVWCILIGVEKEELPISYQKLVNSVKSTQFCLIHSESDGVTQFTLGKYHLVYLDSL